jgi:F0F1-type ATP synthase assembly protein I
MERDETPGPELDGQDRVSNSAREARLRIEEELAQAEAKLSRIEQKGWAVRQGLDEAHPIEAAKRTGDQGSYGGLSQGVALAYAIAGFPLLGFGAGWLIQRLTGSAEWTPILTLAGIALGLGYTVMILRRSQA